MEDFEEFHFISDQLSNIHETILNVPDFELELKNNIIDDSYKNIMHFHNSYEITFCIKAQNQIFVKDIQYLMENNQIMIIPPREVHAIKYNKGTLYQRYVLYFSEDFIINALRGLDCMNMLNYFDTLEYKMAKLSASNIEEISHLFFLILKCVKKQNYASSDKKTRIKAYLIALIVEIFDIFKSRIIEHEVTGPVQIVQNIIKLIDKHYNDDLTLEYIANHFHINKYHLCHIFKKTVGESIIEYLQFRRIMEAQKMLLNTNMKIIDICFNCGFNNIQHFCRVFKKFSDLSPTHYRKAKYLKQEGI